MSTLAHQEAVQTAVAWQILSDHLPLARLAQKSDGRFAIMLGNDTISDGWWLTEKYAVTEAVRRLKGASSFYSGLLKARKATSKKVLAEFGAKFVAPSTI